ncbi:MAG: hypothetical protein IJL78_09200, partial [Lachnospiraceae bacterium]|nr:hypothetical protein [Lachnospiraceae bacterium]
ELIAVYEQYTEAPDPRLLKLLLLHNEEDVLGMPALLPMLYYTDILEDPGRPEEVYRNKNGSRLIISYRSPASFKKTLELTDPSGIRTLFQDHTLTLSVPCVYGELRFFFPNFRDYYYLPVEDRAIHKKLGRFVDKEYRVQAGPDTCFTKRSGFFVPALSGSGLPCYREAYDAKTQYHFLEEGESFPETYGKAFLSSL